MRHSNRLPHPRPRALAAILLVAVLAGCTGAPAVVEPAQPSGYGYTCYAGTYVCQLGAQYPVGSQCTCPGLGAPSYGAVR